MTDSTLRQLKLLEILPRSPSKKSSQDLRRELLERGFDISIRTIQRDLIALSGILPLVSDERDKPYGWSWHKNAYGLNPAMEPIEALTFSLAQEYLEPIMPSKNFKRMKIFFDRANNILKEMDNSSIKNWRDNVRVVPPWQKLIPPKINEQAEDEIYKALFEGNQLNVMYRNKGDKKPKERTINPLGIVLQGVVHRLICTMEDDPKRPRHLPIHRFVFAKSNGNKIKKLKGFKLDKFVKEENIGYLISDKPLHLEVVFDSMAGQHLTETPLSVNQELKELKDGTYLLRASVPNTYQVRWWLQGFGSQVEIIKPVSLREEFKKMTTNLNSMYFQ